MTDFDAEEPRAEKRKDGLFLAVVLAPLFLWDGIKKAAAVLRPKR